MGRPNGELLRADEDRATYTDAAELLRLWGDYVDSESVRLFAILRQEWPCNIAD